MNNLILIAAALMVAGTAYAAGPEAMADDENPPQERRIARPRPDAMPEFPGGMDELIDFLINNLRYPGECAKAKIQGRVLVKFMVLKDGSVDNIEVVKSVHPLLDAEAIRVVKSFPKWTPGTYQGEPVDVTMNLPVTFHL